MTTPPAQTSTTPAKRPYTVEGERVHDEYVELSLKMPKQSIILFFGHDDSFSDNSKYLYLATVAANTEFQVLWCTWSKRLLGQLRLAGLPCFDLGQDQQKSINLLLEAAVAVYCQNGHFWNDFVFGGCLAGAQKVQLWHGISVKHLHFMTGAVRGLHSIELRFKLRYGARVDHFLSTSSAVDGFWVRAFGCRSLLRAGQPRNEVILRLPTPAELIGARLPPAQAELLRQTAKRKVLMAPTHNRDNVLYVTTTAFYERLKAWARANDTVVFVKTHPAMKAAHAAKKDAAAVIPEEPGVLHVLDPEVDVYPWLSRFDALITDYSSIMFDYLLLRRPIFSYDTRAQFPNALDPDYSLIPDTPFRYEFKRENFEAVMERNFDAHPLRASQETLCGQLYETPAGESCAQLIRILVQLGTQTVEKNYSVTLPTPATVTHVAPP